MPTRSQPLTEAEQRLMESQIRNALAQLRRRYDELDRLTGKNAAERYEEAQQRRAAK